MLSRSLAFRWTRGLFPLVNRVVQHAACFAAVASDLVVFRQCGSVVSVVSVHNLRVTDANTTFPIIGIPAARRDSHLARARSVLTQAVALSHVSSWQQVARPTSFSRFAWSSVVPEFSDAQGSHSDQLVNNLPPFTSAQVVCAPWQHQHKRYLNYGVSG